MSTHLRSFFGLALLFSCSTLFIRALHYGGLASHQRTAECSQLAGVSSTSCGALTVVSTGHYMNASFGSDPSGSRLQVSSPGRGDTGRVEYITGFNGSTADVQLAACLNAIPSGGICDARGYGATTQTIAAAVVVGSGKTLQFDPSTLFVPVSSSTNIIQFEPNSVIRGFTFHCGAIPYAGNVFQNDSNVMYANGDHTELGNINVDVSCGGYATGNALSLTSRSIQTGIAFLYLYNWRVVGLRNGALLAATGTGFVNGNHFIDMEWSGTKYGWHLTGAGGSISGNICKPCSYEAIAGLGGAHGVLIDGTAAITGNVYDGDIWDTTTPIRVTNSVGGANTFFGGHWDGSLSDSARMPYPNTYLLSNSGSTGLSAILAGAKVVGSGVSAQNTFSVCDSADSDAAPCKYFMVNSARPGVLNIRNNAYTTNVLTLDDVGNLATHASVRPGAGVKVADLPLASSNAGAMIYVTDSTKISHEGQPCTGDSSDKALAFSDGSIWKCF